MSFMTVCGLARLTRDPELRFTAGGTPICSFGVVVNKKFGGNDTAHFFDCKAWGKMGEVINEHFAKGGMIGIASGDLEYESWEKDGQKRSKHVIVVRSWTFAGDSGKQRSTANAPADFNPDDF